VIAYLIASARHRFACPLTFVTVVALT